MASSRLPSVETMNKTMSKDTGIPGLAGLGLVSIVLILAGCSAIDDLAHGSSRVTSSNATAFAREHAGVADWLPADAMSVALVSSTRADDVMTLTYESETAPEGCETLPRQSAPTMSVDTDIDVYATPSVLVCGSWAVAHDADQWLAWTPATEA